MTFEVAEELFAFFGKARHGDRRPAAVLSDDAIDAAKLIERELGKDSAWARAMDGVGKMGGFGRKRWGGRVVGLLERMEGGEGEGVIGCGEFVEVVEKEWGWGSDCGGEGKDEAGGAIGEEQEQGQGERERERGVRAEEVVMVERELGLEEQGEEEWMIGESDLEDNWEELLDGHGQEGDEMDVEMVA